MVSQIEIYFSLTLQWQNLRKISKKVYGEERHGSPIVPIVSHLAEFVNHGYAEHRVIPNPKFPDKVQDHEYKLTYNGHNDRNQRYKDTLRKGILPSVARVKI